MLLPLLASFAVLPPDGWVEDPALAAKAFEPAAQVEVRAFRPADGSALFVVAKGSASTRPLLDALEDQARTAGGQVLSRTHDVDHGRTIDQLELAGPDGATSHVRIVVGMHGTQAEQTIGICRGRGPALAACEAKLAVIGTPPEPDVDLSKLLYVIAGVAAGGVVLGVGGRTLLRGVRDRDLRRSPALVDSELLAISGIVRAAGEPLEAPLSGRSCVAHRSRARVFGGANKAQLVAEPIEQEATPFVVETRHGAVRIDARDLALDVAPSGLPDRSTLAQRTFRTRNALERDVPAYFDEIVIAPGARVTIRGVVSLEQDPHDASERGYREGAATRARLVATAAQPVTVLRVW